MKNFNCIVIGTGTFATSCIDLLIKNQYKIEAIVSSCNFVNRQAAVHKIPIFSNISALKSLDQKIDFLFNIGSTAYLAPEILTLPKYYPVNFHPSPLPKYAGIRPASWAIINAEKQFGCAWHIMNELLDGGEILSDAQFDISPEDTALTLTLKSYKHGLKIFADMLTAFKTGNHCKKSQDVSLRTYYSKKDTLYNAGLIDWHKPAVEIDRMARACHLGMQADKEFCLKLIYAENCFIIKNLKCLDTQSNTPPGKIIEINNEGFIVATLTHNILIKELIDQSNQIISGKKFADQFFLRVNTAI